MAFRLREENNVSAFSVEEDSQKHQAQDQDGMSPARDGDLDQNLSKGIPKATGLSSMICGWEYQVVHRVREESGPLTN